MPYRNRTISTPCIDMARRIIHLRGALKKKRTQSTRPPAKREGLGHPAEAAIPEQDNNILGKLQN